MGLSKELSCELGVSPTAASNPMGVSNQRFEALFPPAGALGCTVCLALLPFLPVYLCANVGLWGLPAVPLPAPFVPQSATSLGPQVLSAPPTSLDECFFFISLVVGLLCGLIFCQFWLFLFLNCCPSFGCARRRSVSTYASILAGSSRYILFKTDFAYTILYFF